jgi:hypothetical protein
MRKIGVAPTLNDFVRWTSQITDWLKTVTERFNLYRGTAYPSASEVPEGQWVFFHNTATGIVRVYTKINGVLTNVFGSANLGLGTAAFQDMNNMGVATFTGAVDFNSLATFNGRLTIANSEVMMPTFDSSASGSTIVLTTADRIWLNITPATKAAMTWRLPASPAQGQLVRICTDGQITATTFQDSAGVAANVKNAPTTLLAGQFCEFMYRTANTTWYRVG